MQPAHGQQCKAHEQSRCEKQGAKDDGSKIWCLQIAASWLILPVQHVLRYNKRVGQDAMHAAMQSRADTPPAVDTHTCRGSGCRNAYPGTLRITLAAMPRDMEHRPSHRGSSVVNGWPLLLFSCASAALAAAFAAAKLVCMARLLWSSIDGCRVPSQPASAAADASLQLLQHIIPVSCTLSLDCSLWHLRFGGHSAHTGRVLHLCRDNEAHGVAASACSLQRRDGATHSLPTRNTSPTSRVGTTPTWCLV